MGGPRSHAARSLALPTLRYGRACGLERAVARTGFAVDVGPERGARCRQRHARSPVRRRDRTAGGLSEQPTSIGPRSFGPSSGSCRSVSSITSTCRMAPPPTTSTTRSGRTSTSPADGAGPSSTSTPDPSTRWLRVFGTSGDSSSNRPTRPCRAPMPPASQPPPIEASPPSPTAATDGSPRRSVGVPTGPATGRRCRSRRSNLTSRRRRCRTVTISTLHVRIGPNAAFDNLCPCGWTNCSLAPSRSLGSGDVDGLAAAVDQRAARPDSGSCTSQSSGSQSPRWRSPAWRRRTSSASAPGRPCRQRRRGCGVGVRDACPGRVAPPTSPKSSAGWLLRPSPAGSGEAVISLRDHGSSTVLGGTSYTCALRC